MSRDRARKGRSVVIRSAAPHAPPLIDVRCKSQATADEALVVAICAQAGSTSRRSIALVADMYILYCVSFKTAKGTFRKYVGFTRSLVLREWWHARKPVAWMKCSERGGEWSYDVLDTAPTKAAALALEALHAARLMVSAMDEVRGGPWVKPTLPDGAEAEIRAVAPIRSFDRLAEVAEELKGGLLYKHLKELNFVDAASAPAGAVVTRGAVVVRRRKGGKSGSTGNASRKSQMRDKNFVKGSNRHKRLHRGIDYAERRAVEQSRRPPRRNQSQEPARMRKEAEAAQRRAQRRAQRMAIG